MPETAPSMRTVPPAATVVPVFWEVPSAVSTPPATLLRDTVTTPSVPSRTLER